MDSRIVLDAVLHSESLPATTQQTTLVSKAMTGRFIVINDYSLYLDGFYAYAEGQALEDMPTDAQRRGWWADQAPKLAQAVSKGDTGDIRQLVPAEAAKLIAGLEKRLSERENQLAEVAA